MPTSGLQSIGQPGFIVALQLVGAGNGSSGGGTTTVATTVTVSGSGQTVTATGSTSATTSNGVSLGEFYAVAIVAMVFVISTVVLAITRRRPRP